MSSNLDLSKHLNGGKVENPIDNCSSFNSPSLSFLLPTHPVGQKKKGGGLQTEPELKIMKLIHKTHMLDLQLLFCLLSAFLRHCTFDCSSFLPCVVMVIDWLTEPPRDLGPLENQPLGCVSKRNAAHFQYEA